jgi:hypothetical protein
MKTKNYIIILVLFFVSQTITAQEPLDTVYISSHKKSVESVAKVRYFYYPNLHTYFDTQRKLYIYKKNGNWVTSENIESSFRGYSLRNGYHVTIKEYIGDEPYLFFDQDKRKYPADYSSRPKPKAITSTD